MRQTIAFRIVHNLENKDENIEVSLQIANNVDEMKKQLIQKLVQDVKTKFSEKYSDKPFQLDVSNIGEGKSYEQINLKISNFDKGDISLEFQKSNFDIPCLGIKFHQEADVKSNLHSEKMKSLLEEHFRDKKIWTSPLWPAGYYFDPRDWKNSSKVWLMVRDRSMATKILDEIVEIYEVLIKNGYEITS